MHIVHFSENIFNNVTLLKECQHISLSQCPGQWRGRLYSVDVKTILALDTSAEGFMMKNSRIPHYDVGPGLFVSRTIGKGEVVVHYYGSLVYVDLTIGREKTKMYGDDVMRVAEITFQKLTNALSEKIIYKDGI